ncbi:MAG: ribose-phosphate pyrophosphokinase-like domain-containing protein, partial [Selenomonadaceae bacterium]|nr:ribose-phosphate pyrophosphokinase-like domain-containing protein [Selenomonadaceae bacterium]
MTGNANPELAQKIADHIGVKIFDTFVGRFNNGESQVMISDSIRGKDIFIVQPTSQPVNDNLMDLLIMTDACKRASAHS